MNFIRSLTRTAAKLKFQWRKQNYAMAARLKDSADKAKTSSLRLMMLGSSGGGTLLGISLLSKSKAENETAYTDVPNLDLIIREADVLYDNYLIDNALGILRRHAKGQCCELLWRLARATCEKAKLCQDKEEKKRLFYESLDIIRRAIVNEREEGCSSAHKWYAIILDYTSAYEGTRARLHQSYEIRRHLEKALDIDGTDPTTWHILGLWHFTFADMPSYQRLIASAVFETPPSSTYEDALANFEKAEYIRPNFYSANKWYLAEVHDRLNHKEEALKYYKETYRMPVVTADDCEFHAKAYAKLTKLLGTKDLSKMD
ncbi:hypothetical protein AB6A40_001814 [Gnathostoma spinigerum]|uniref:Regulator of microtubule dynamics protein 1 n=1 Tax=Gnathostoma spinigerum TaxID=75299 RepID=A0ABD6EFL6_9BILA